VFNLILTKAINEKKNLNENAGKSPTELLVSGDGSWFKRSFTYLLVIVGKYSSKIINVIVKSNIQGVSKKSEHLNISENISFTENQKDLFIDLISLTLSDVAKIKFISFLK